MKVILSAVLSVLLLFSVSFPAQAAMNNTELENYLKEINLTSEELNEYLMSFDLTLEDFEDVEELRDTLGPRVTTETLNQLLADYDMTREELDSLLKEYGELEEGKTIEETFLFIFDIEDIIALNTSLEDIDFSEVEELFGEIGITEEEFTRFLDHIIKVSERDPSLPEKLDALAERMTAFEDFETINELSPAQISELMSITDEFKNLLQLNFSFYLVKDGVKTPISFQNLLSIKQTNGADLLIEVSNKAGALLLDVKFTGEMIGSDIIQETGNVIENTTTKAPKPTEKPKTVKGGKLPNTAGDYLEAFLFGLVLLAGAIFTFRKVGALK